MEINPETLEIEIVDIEPIDGGVQVFARAWSDGEQIGFGKDGSVDIERFRIFNPPILVEDPNGDIVRTWQEEKTGEPSVTKTRTLREDPEEATLQSIEGTIKEMKNKVFNSQNIVSGKKGNTTSTFYPSAGTVSPCDGRIVKYDLSAPGSSFSTLRTGTGNFASATEASFSDWIIQAMPSSTGYRVMNRVIIMFDTSAIDDADEISAATLSVYGNGAINKQNAVPNSEITIGVEEITTASDSNIATSDYNNGVGTLLTDIRDGDDYVDAAYNPFTMNAAGLAAISKTGISKFAIAQSGVITGSEPAGFESNEYGHNFPIILADTAGTTTDPKLVVEHSAGGPTANNSARRLLLMTM